LATAVGLIVRMSMTGGATTLIFLSRAGTKLVQVFSCPSRAACSEPRPAGVAGTRALKAKSELGGEALLLAFTSPPFHFGFEFGQVTKAIGLRLHGKRRAAIDALVVDLAEPRPLRWDAFRLVRGGIFPCERTTSGSNQKEIARLRRHRARIPAEGVARLYAGVEFTNGQAQGKCIRSRRKLARPRKERT
jgi:hypothetical protein